MSKKHQISYYRNRVVGSDNIAFRNAVAAKRAAKRAELEDLKELNNNYNEKTN